MKNEYLQQLLKENKTVIIPGLGAFVANDSEHLPILFNEYLKFDDGLVVGYISKSENISKDDAGKKVETFVSGIKSLLDSGRDVVFGGLGKLKKDASGKLIFSHDSNAKSESISSETKINITPEIKKEVPPPVKEETKPIVPKEEKKETIQPKEEKKELKVKPEEKTKTKEKIKVKKEPGKKKKWLLYIILLVILGGGSTAGYIFRQDIINLFNPPATVENYVSKAEEPKIETPVADTLISDTTVVENTEVIVEPEISAVPKPKKNNTKTNTSSYTETAQSGNYYVIIGCYSSDFNAENMMLKADAKGLEGKNIGTFGGLIYVSVYSSSDLASATEKLNAIKADFPKAWVFNKR